MLDAIRQAIDSIFDALSSVLEAIFDGAGYIMDYVAGVCVFVLLPYLCEIESYLISKVDKLICKWKKLWGYK